MASHPSPTIRTARTARIAAGTLAASVAALLPLGPLTPTPASAATPPAHGRVTAAVLDLDGAGRAPEIHGTDTAYDTASIVKVDILAALLLKAQDAGRRLTAEERGHAEPMIRRSDNAAANALWREIGRAPGLAEANKRLGLTSTTGGPGTKWGLTRTTAGDQIRLLRAVFDDGGTAKAGATGLNQASRAYLRSLMSQVTPEQAWGVSAPAASGSASALKNGWLQRSTSGLWDVNSIGEVTVRGHRYLVAVLSDGSASMRDGVSLVERTARAALA
ncbi:class A beta-lactamase-related serine hydrolase [Streptomyces sp. LP11]|uniref:Class A beta-lactamase-related serine hydrolase n=1 Tax=Streptomyces pyxinicus TaxID=2970331 RepID=A0ABT2B8P5_9ACTN|nr:class A beta-lactamase-related serine hydrolase [Streptomyces sp. LP11]MCS0604889.1 class A beta-lactamase-related serine hydrolase [Streptomyces sp. LP11]